MNFCVKTIMGTNKSRTKELLHAQRTTYYIRDGKERWKEEKPTTDWMAARDSIILDILMKKKKNSHRNQNCSSEKIFLQFHSSSKKYTHTWALTVGHSDVSGICNNRDEVKERQQQKPEKRNTTTYFYCHSFRAKWVWFWFRCSLYVVCASVYMSGHLLVSMMIVITCIL